MSLLAQLVVLVGLGVLLVASAFWPFFRWSTRKPIVLTYGPRTNAPNGCSVAFCARCDAELAWSALRSSDWYRSDGMEETTVLITTHRVRCVACGLAHKLPTATCRHCGAHRYPLTNERYATHVDGEM